MSEVARSVAKSGTSEVTFVRMKPARTVQRTSTTFQLAQPAPTLTQKQKFIYIHPRLLLQLQRLSPDSRPKPVIDLLQSSAVIPRLAHKFPRMFSSLAVLGMNDFLLVRNEEYDPRDDSTTETADLEEEHLSNRDIIAVICQMPKGAGGLQGKTEIVLNDSSVWVATPIRNGLYELTTVNENGSNKTARWVKRRARPNSADFSTILDANPFKYTFSIIDPNSRRHPIIGTLTQKTLYIPNFYTAVSRPFSGEQDSMDEEQNPERTTHAIDEDVKRLIQVTGMWVALREGLSPYFKNNDIIAPGSTSVSRRGRLHERPRSLPLPPEPSRPAMGATGKSTTESDHSTLAAVGCKPRQTRASGPAPVGSAAPSTKWDVLKYPQRSSSSGTAFIQRLSTRRSRRPLCTLQSNRDGDSVQRRPRSSMAEYRAVAISPPSLMFPGSSITTPNTPKRPQEQIQAAYISFGLPQTLQGFEAAVRHSGANVDRDKDPALEWAVKPKTRRCKAFKNFIQRSQPRSA
jgi:hypothetical protein